VLLRLSLAKRVLLWKTQMRSKRAAVANTYTSIHKYAEGSFAGKLLFNDAHHAVCISRRKKAPDMNVPIRSSGLNNHELYTGIRLHRFIVLNRYSRFVENAPSAGRLAGVASVTGDVR
jgi:hypothetical protein